MLSDNALKYTLEHLLRVALPSPSPMPFSYTVSEETVVVRLPENVTLEIDLLSDAEVDNLMAGEAMPRWIPSADTKVQIPAFSPERCKTLTIDGSYADQTLRIPFDLVTLSFILLSRDEEYRGLPRDEHDRFLYNFSLAKRYEFVHLPLVDEYALLLRLWIFTYLKPSWNISPRQSKIIPTHDIDLLHRFTNPWQAFKSVFGRDLLINHSASDAKTSWAAYQECKTDGSKDPYVAAIRELISVSANHGLQSVFFFKAQIPHEPDFSYDVFDQNVKNCLQEISQAGMQVGLHGSYESYRDIDRFQQEKSRLSQLLSKDIDSCRQHYLRFSLHRNVNDNNNAIFGSIYETSEHKNAHTNTLQVWQQSGIRHDYTLGYAEQPGFRCGTCHPYPLYDLDNDCPTDIIEHPLIVMDGSMFDYLHLDYVQSNELIQNLLSRCRAVEGDFIILWHNHLLSRNYRPAFEQVYLPTIKY